MKSRPSSEESLLALVAREIPPPGAEVLTGIGDDCAVIRHPKGPRLLTLLKTDALVEGIHYAKGAPLHAVGWKALCRAVSDIAAMGGTPRHALVTVAAPATWGTAEWRALYRGLGRAARKFDLSIVGGETVRSSGGAFVSVALTGEVPKDRLKLRSGGRPGDLVCVTGRLGGSFRSGRHLRFEPRVAEGRWLAAQRGVTAMMDLSDGLGSDLPKLASASGCSYRVDLPALPRHPGCSIREAVSDGEDYELLLTLSPHGSNGLLRRWKKAFPRLPLTPIGKLLPPGEPSTPLAPGYDHLARTPRTR